MVKLIGIIALMLVLTTAGFAQRTVLRGIVYEEGSGETLPFATVVAYSAGEMLGGTVADFDGLWVLDLEDIVKVDYLEIQFVGFEKQRVEHPDYWTKVIMKTSGGFIDPPICMHRELIPLSIYGARRSIRSTTVLRSAGFVN